MPQKEQVPTFMVEDARIIYRNFAGRETLYNLPGNRNFAVILDEETAKQMLEDGWNVKWPKPGEEGDIGDPFVSVAVQFKYYPPRIVMITSKARTTPLTEDMVEVLDWADIAKVDLICRGNVWNDKGDIKAYVKTMFVTINEDPLELKYSINEVEG